LTYPANPVAPLSTANRAGQFRLVVMNLEHGGVRGADYSPWEASMAALHAWDPDVVLLQEMCSPTAKVAGLRAHLWRTANEVGMTPVLGPPTPQSITGNHPAILVRDGLVILDEGPPLWDTGGGTWPAWCHVLVQDPGLPYPLALYSVHLPSRDSEEHRSQCRRLASLIWQSGTVSVAGGDWNNFADAYSQKDLEVMPGHLRTARMVTTPHADGTVGLASDLKAHNILLGVGLVDLAAAVPAARREPPVLCSTSVHDNGRIDREYGTPGLAGALERQIQAATGGSDHHARLTVFSLAGLAALSPREPAP
jgi:hypothetical protein